MTRSRRRSIIALVLTTAAFAFAASVASAQAAEFKWSETGELEGTQTSNQVFTTTAGGKEKVTCKKAHSTGEIIKKEAEEQEFTVHYSECTAEGVPVFGSAPATVSNAEYDLFADGTVEVLNTIIIHVAVPIFPCDIVVGPQDDLGSISYHNIDPDSGGGTIEETSAVTGIESTKTGLCPSGTNGTYSGSNLGRRVGGGEISWQP